MAHYGHGNDVSLSISNSQLTTQNYGEDDLDRHFASMMNFSNAGNTGMPYMGGAVQDAHAPWTPGAFDNEEGWEEEGEVQYADPYGEQEEVYYDDGYQEEFPPEDYVPKFIPALDDMLLLVTSQEMLDAYGYVRPEPVRAMTTNSIQKPSTPVIPQMANQLAPLPPLTQRRWSLDDCDLLVAHFKEYLKAILKDALTVKNLDLVNTSPEVTQKVFLNTGNQLKPTRDIANTIKNINSGSDQHNRSQRDVANLTETMIQSGVSMLRTAMAINKGQVPISEFVHHFNPFLTNARSLLNKLNELHWNTGPAVLILND